MPVNFQQALTQIREMGRQALRQEEEAQARRQEAWQILQQYGAELDSLQQLVDRASAENQHLRCAAPFEEILNHRYPAPALEPCYTLLAADGSQINPDRHAMIEFGAINVGTIRVRPGSALAPQEGVSSKLLFIKDLYMSNGSPLPDDVVALMRDMAERQQLVELALEEHAFSGNDPDHPPAIVSLTDGPLELFREGKGMPEFDQKFGEYLQVLEKLADLGTATAGYVDKPRSDLVVRLLELVVMARLGKLEKAGLERPFQWITDASLFSQLLQPGDRSAVFAIHSGSRQSFQGRLSLHFFYLNVGRPGHAYLSRVEIPRWVASSKRLINLLHAALLAQSYQMGVRAYPYILHRAHEIAVIRFDERDQIENMIAAELRRQGVTLGERSNKQWAKDTQYS